MQQEAFANTEDFGGPDPLTELPRAALRPGKDAPYARYQLGTAYDEMFAPDGKAAPHPMRRWIAGSPPCRWKN